MLRKRSRVPSKQAIVGDNHSNHSWLPPENQGKPSTFYFTSRFFKEFFTRKIDPMMSPASVLDQNPFSLVSNFLVFDNKTTKNTIQQRAWEQPNSKQGIGLALIDENCEINNAAITTKQQRRKLVVFGAQLRILVPCLSPEPPREFGIKTPRNNVWPFGSKDSDTQVHPEVSFTKNESISMHDIDEESEDYTCVISHGPNPKTTHIFGNCIVENCCGKIAGLPSCASKRNGNFTSLGDLTPSKDDFLSSCYHCKKKLAEGRDIYMYRGEKAFCSEECRCQEMLFDGDES